MVAVKETRTFVVQKTPVRYWADLPDLEPGDKVVREDGITYTIAGDYNSLISPDGVYHDPMTLQPYPDQKQAAVECEEYDTYKWYVLGTSSSRHRDRCEQILAEMDARGEVAGEDGFSVEQALRIEIEMRKFDKEDERALQAAHG